MEYSRQMLRLTVAEVCLQLGWSSINSTPLAVLTEVLERYIVEMLRKTHKYAELGGRTQPNLRDLRLTFEDFHISLSELTEFVQNADFRPFSNDVPRYPAEAKDVPTEEQQQQQQPGQGEAAAGQELNGEVEQADEQTAGEDTSCANTEGASATTAGGEKPVLTNHVDQPSTSSVTTAGSHVDQPPQLPQPVSKRPRFLPEEAAHSQYQMRSFVRSESGHYVAIAPGKLPQVSHAEPDTPPSHSPLSRSRRTSLDASGLDPGGKSDSRSSSMGERKKNKSSSKHHRHHGHRSHSHHHRHHKHRHREHLKVKPSSGRGRSPRKSGSGITPRKLTKESRGIGSSKSEILYPTLSSNEFPPPSPVATPSAENNVGRLRSYTDTIDAVVRGSVGGGVSSAEEEEPDSFGAIPPPPPPRSPSPRSPSPQCLDTSRNSESVDVLTESPPPRVGASMAEILEKRKREAEREVMLTETINDVISQSALEFVPLGSSPDHELVDVEGVVNDELFDVEDESESHLLAEACASASGPPTPELTLGGGGGEEVIVVTTEEVPGSPALQPYSAALGGKGASERKRGRPKGKKNKQKVGEREKVRERDRMKEREKEWEEPIVAEVQEALEPETYLEEGDIDNEGDNEEVIPVTREPEDDDIHDDNIHDDNDIQDDDDETREERDITDVSVNVGDVSFNSPLWVNMPSPPIRPSKNSPQQDFPPENLSSPGDQSQSWGSISPSPPASPGAVDLPQSPERNWERENRDKEHDEQEGGASPDLSRSPWQSLDADDNVDVDVTATVLEEKKVETLFIGSSGNKFKIKMKGLGENVDDVTDRKKKEEREERRSKQREAELVTERWSKQREAELVTERRSKQKETELVTEKRSKQKEAELVTERQSKQNEAELVTERRDEEKKKDSRKDSKKDSREKERESSKHGKDRQKEEERRSNEGMDRKKAERKERSEDKKTREKERGREAEREKDRSTVKEASRGKDLEKEAAREAKKEKEREREAEKEAAREREKEREAAREAAREKEREREALKIAAREREKEREKVKEAARAKEKEREKIKEGGRGREKERETGKEAVRNRDIERDTTKKSTKGREADKEANRSKGTERETGRGKESLVAQKKREKGERLAAAREEEREKERKEKELERKAEQDRQWDLMLEASKKKEEEEERARVEEREREERLREMERELEQQRQRVLELQRSKVESQSEEEEIKEEEVVVGEKRKRKQKKEKREKERSSKRPRLNEDRGSQSQEGESGGESWKRFEERDKRLSKDERRHRHRHHHKKHRRDDKPAAPAAAASPAQESQGAPVSGQPMVPKLTLRFGGMGGSSMTVGGSTKRETSPPPLQQQLPTTTTTSSSASDQPTNMPLKLVIKPFSNSPNASSSTSSTAGPTGSVPPGGSRKSRKPAVAALGPLKAVSIVTRPGLPSPMGSTSPSSDSSSDSSFLTQPKQSINRPSGKSWLDLPAHSATPPPRLHSPTRVAKEGGGRKSYSGSHSQSGSLSHSLSTSSSRASSRSLSPPTLYKSPPIDAAPTNPVPPLIVSTKRGRGRGSAAAKSRSVSRRSVATVSVVSDPASLPPLPPPSSALTSGGKSGAKRRSVVSATVGKIVNESGVVIWICPQCKMPDDGSPMIGCDECDDWYHWPCVGIHSEPSDDEWFCSSCRGKGDGGPDSFRGAPPALIPTGHSPAGGSGGRKSSGAVGRPKKNKK